MMARSRAPVGPDGQATKPKDPRGTFRRIVEIFRPYRGQLTLLAATIMITAGLGVVNPLLIKAVFDKALFGPNKICSGVPCPNLPLLYRLVALGLAIPVVTSLIGVGQTFLSNLLGLRLMRDLRDRLYAHLQSLSMRFFTSTRTGEIQSRLTNDVAGVQSIVTDTASSILSNVVIIASSFAAMAWLSWRLTILSLILVPLFVFFTFRVGKSRRALQSVAQQSLADLTAITEETLSVSGILLAKVFGRQRYEITRFTKENQRFTEIQLRQRMTGRYFFALVGTFFSITPFLVYLVAGLFQHSGLTAGDIVAFTTLQARLFFPIGQMLSITTDVQSSMALFERIFEYMDLPVEIADAPDARPLAPEDVRGEVAFRHVQFRYDDPVPPAQPEQGAAPEEDGAAEGPREWTLDGVDFDIQPGQLAALVGPSGAGKTTTTYLVPRLYDVQEGAVEIDGIDVRKITLESLGGLMGVVTQETYLFHTTVRRNLQQGKLDATQEELEAACKAAFIHERIMELPEGYDTMVGERGYKLSGGEKQRLAIARVILKDPRILILDEATSSLDTTSERLVQEALRPLMGGRTTIAIAHRLSTILSADVIFVLERGRIVERGTHAELVRQGGLYAELYEQQFRGGLVEAECEDGLVLATGAIVPASNDHA
ncbi:MAG: ATP-binding cassette, subfamily bacterial [Actinomycetota bacterium]|nr:ATP-binding cassette, subfamily bacterial [Actinomycetota bacterium]